MLIPPKPGVSADPRPAAANDGTIINVSLPTSHYLPTAFLSKLDQITMVAADTSGGRSVLQYASKETSVQIPFRGIQSDPRRNTKVCSAQSSRCLDVQEGNGDTNFSIGGELTTRLEALYLISQRRKVRRPKPTLLCYTPTLSQMTSWKFR